MTDPAVLRPAVFLDRDGTVIEERGYLDRLDLLSVFPWSADALRLLKHAGFVTVLVTNQSAVGRGLIDEPFLDRVHGEMNARLEPGGGAVDHIYFCPHIHDAEVARYRQVCECRKPRPGMIERAARELGLDVRRSVMVGDRWLDVACGRAAGARAILVRTGHGAHEERVPPPPGVRADAILNNLMEAAGWILRNSSR